MAVKKARRKVKKVKRISNVARPIFNLLSIIRLLPLQICQEMLFHGQVLVD